MIIKLTLYHSTSPPALSVGLESPIYPVYENIGVLTVCVLRMQEIEKNVSILLNTVEQTAQGTVNV